MMKFSRCVQVLCLLAISAVLCAASARAADEPQRFDIRFITYNICGLPDLVTEERDLAAAENRMPVIGEKLKAYDIIGVQEAFIQERFLVERRLRLFYAAYGGLTGRYRWPGSGVAVFSKWRMTKSIYEKWEQSKGYDSLSGKGFVMATIPIYNGPVLDVYDFHAQAGNPEIRITNYQQLDRALEQYSRGTGHAIIVMGDFNCEVDEPECDWFIAKQKLAHAAGDAVDTSAIDHIFYNENESGWNISVLSAGFEFTQPFNGQKLSDHDAFAAVLRFEKAAGE
jgi:endonuclease/exonuclease/phosphatase family metal-dependent hydrolase